MLEKKISSIEFKLLSPEMVRKMSAIEIKTADTYDKDGYPMEEGLMDAHLGVINPGLRCKTCGQTMRHCPGHFGSLELIRPVLHPKYSKKTEILLQCTCKECGRILLKDEKIEKLKKLSKQESLEKNLKLKTQKEKKCPHCNAKLEKIKLDKPTNFYLGKERIYPHEIREWLEKIPQTDLKLFGYNPEITKPEWLVLTVLPVPPITIRPSITLETGMKSEDDLTHKLVDIVRINIRLKENIDAGAPQLIIEDLWDLLQYHITTYFDNEIAGVPPAKHRSGRPLKTLVERLKGKKGRFRYNLTGKRVNYAARSTITPDPFLSINEVGVPEAIADELTVPDLITDWNKGEYKKAIKDSSKKIVSVIRPDGRRKMITDETRKEIADEIEPGYKIERIIRDGDIALFNRQPSLHRCSMMAHNVKIMPGKTLRLNPVDCKPFNADFDGDEMNLHIPQTEEGKTEARELMFVQNQVISPRYGAPLIILDEDGVSGTYVLTMDVTEFSKEEAFECFYEFGITKPPKPDRKNNYSGRLIFSTLLPKDLNLEYRSKTCQVIERTDPSYKCLGSKCPYCVKIKNGKLVKGVIDGNSLGEAKGRLIDAMARNYPAEVVEQFYYKINRIIGKLLTDRGMTVSLAEYEIGSRIKSGIEKSIEEELSEGDKLVKQYNNRTLELIPGRTRADSFEIKMMRLGARVKQGVENQIMKEKVDKTLSNDPELNTSLMILSGSRGNSTNLMNIGGFWGQASVREGRPRRGFRKRALAVHKKGDIGPLAGGFIKENFITGMNGSEYFLHSMGGRQGEVDTGVSTKVSGYLYRRLANSLKDLSVKTDHTVRASGDIVIQYLYGEDGVFPMKTTKGKSVDVELEAEKILKGGADK